MFHGVGALNEPENKMTLNEIIKRIKSGNARMRSDEVNRLIDYKNNIFMDSSSMFDEPFILTIKAKMDALRASIIKRQIDDLIQPELDFLSKFFVEQQAKADIAAEKETQKALTILLSELSNLLNLITVARLFAALSLHALRKQKNINDRVVIAMTEKFTLVQLSSEKISYRHDATH
jgi:hypothetical protein